MTVNVDLGLLNTEQQKLYNVVMA